MSLFSFVHEDSRIVWAIRKLQDAIVNSNSSFSNIASATGEISTPASVFFTIMQDMIITPPAGTYLVTFSGDIYPDFNFHNSMGIAIAVDGVEVTDSQRDIQCAEPVSFKTSFCSQAKVTVNGLQEIEGMWNINAGTVFNMHRTLTIVKTSP